MNLKKIIALLVAVTMVLALSSACGDKDSGGKVSWAPDWTEYDSLIAQIKTTTDFAQRVTLMHQAEDILMETGAIMPIYHYNDSYMMKPTLEGMFSNAFGTKFFLYCTNGTSDTLRLQLASEPDRLDPALNSSVDGACLAAASFGGLYTYDSTGNPAPNFASGYTVSEDGLTYTFTLKDGLKWSDGSPSPRPISSIPGSAPPTPRPARTTPTCSPASRATTRSAPMKTSPTRTAPPGRSSSALIPTSSRSRPRATPSPSRS